MTNQDRSIAILILIDHVQEIDTCSKNDSSWVDFLLNFYMPFDILLNVGQNIAHVRKIHSPPTCSNINHNKVFCFIQSRLIIYPFY